MAGWANAGSSTGTSQASEPLPGCIATTYRFEEVPFVEVSAVAAGKSLTVDAGPLVIRAATGGRALLGALLRTVPRPLAVHTR
ncbi:hypothetical protein [Arthrobacter sp. NPDC056493]|uniref:hypothetical protein n=1 Tax=Arthrobacter sp. NPDC056493 TaxID=3345839 RepID=UPI00366BC215